MTVNEEEKNVTDTKKFQRGGVSRDQENILEGVTGGTDAAIEFYNAFSQTNCLNCGKRHIRCPYNDDPAEIYAALHDVNVCPERGGYRPPRPEII